MTVKFTVKSIEQVRDDGLRTYGGALIARGIPNPNVSSGTEIYCRWQAIGNQIGVAYAQLPAAADAMMPDTAQGDDLKRDAGLHGLFLREAGGSAGDVILAVTVATPVAVITGQPLLDASGQTFIVSVGGSYSNGDLVPVEATSKGVGTNLPAGTVLRWVSPPPFSTSTAQVGPDGLRDGVDAEDIEGLRARFLEFLRDPPNGSNAAQMNAWAEASTVAVQKAFTYPCFYGPDTVQVCAVGAPTATNKSRSINATTFTTKVVPYITALVPEYAELLVTRSTDAPTDVSMGLSLPVSTAGGGPGGGWTDAAPWPTFASSGKADVTVFTSTTVFAVNADAAPTAGVTQVAWLSPFDWKLYVGTVLSFTGTGPYAITIDTPFVGMAVGEFISPNATDLKTYFDAALAHFAVMGPGQVTTTPGLLPRGLRKPAVEASWPSDLNALLLRAIEDSGPEVAATVQLSFTLNPPPIPADPASGPSILIPRRLAFYPI